MPTLIFGTLSAGSDLIDAGVNVGLPYLGVAPDLGWIEYTGSVTGFPEYVSSVIQNATPARLDITYDLILANIIPATSAFTVRVNAVNRSVNSVVITGNYVQLTLSSPVVYGDVISFSYTKPATNPLQTPSGGQAASLASKSVTNNVSAGIVIPTVTTSDATSIASTSAYSGGNVISDGGSTVTARGVCWNTVSNPTISNSHTSNGTGTGSFTSSITGLVPNTTYFVRAYATNSAGTNYGINVSFTTCPSAPTVGTITQPTCMVASGSVVLNSLPSAGTWTLTRNPGGTTATGTGTSTTITDLTAGTYTFIVSVSGGCSSVASSAVLINAQPVTPTAPVLGIITQPTCVVATGSVILNGLPSSGAWILTRYPGAVTTAGSGTTTTISALASGTYNYTVTSAAGCVSPISASIVINAQPATPTATISEPITVCKDAPNPSVTFTGVGGTPPYAFSYSYNDSEPFYVNTSGANSSVDVDVPLETADLFDFRLWSVTDNNGCSRTYLNLGTIVRVASATVSTENATIITSGSAKLNGTINANNFSADITFEYGLTPAYGSTTAASPATVTGTDNIAVSATISGLTSNTTYHYRVKALSSECTTFGNDISFTTYKSDAITDVEGNYYNIVTIGSQVWMAENLKTTLYNDGSNIPNVTDNVIWDVLTSPAYAWYGNNIVNKQVYGALYNWYAVETGKLCPVGWHVPTDAQLTKLTNYVGGESVAGGKLKEIGTTHWNSPNEGATDEYGFTAFPGGARLLNGVFYSIGDLGSWWSSIDTLSTYAWHRFVWNNNIRFSRIYDSKTDGFSVRCLKDNIDPTIVTNANDSGVGSLRNALEYANSNPGKDTITFNIPGTGPFAIQLLSPLPSITDPVVIDGFTQPGASNSKLMIELDGTNAGSGSNGLTIRASNCIVRGLVINRFSSAGILIDNYSSGNIIEGNYLGTNINGTTDLGNAGSGISVMIGAKENRIGGMTSSERNIISGNNGGIFLNESIKTSVLGNYIGVDASGKIPLGNANFGVNISDGRENIIGGANPGERNVISSNGGDGSCSSLWCQ